MLRISAIFIFFLCAAGLCFSPYPAITVNGTVASDSDRKPLFDAAILVQGYSGIGGTMFQDSSFSDSMGTFKLTLADSNRYAPSILVEMAGYKTRSIKLPPLSAQTIALDSIYLTQYTLQDSVSYSVSGTVTDNLNQGIRDAVVSIALGSGASAIFSLKDTTTQWGGYFNVSTRQQYRASPIAVHLKVEKAGFITADTSQTLASSTQDFVLNVTLEKSPSSVRRAIRLLTQANTSSARAYMVDGRRYPVSAIKASVAKFVIGVTQDGSRRISVQVK